MRRVGLRVSTLAFCAAALACESATAPTSDSYAGQWTGMTAQGRTISFTISGDEAVTAITLGYDFNGCSGSQTFANLKLSIAPNVQCIPGPCPSTVTSYRAFAYSDGNRLDGPATDLNGLFLTSATAEGRVNFHGYPGCGSAVGVNWSATRR